MIPVCWYEGIFGLYAHEGTHGRSRYACCGLMNSMFDSYDCEHFSGWSGLPQDTKGAVVVVHGGHLRNDVANINRDCARLQWVVFMGCGDEEQDFPYSELRHPNMRLWMQSPVPGRAKADHFGIVGYPCDIHEHLVPNQERTLDWFFAGQNSHRTREECLVQLRRLGGGKLLETKVFYTGMPHDEYYRTLGQAKIVLCPSGPVCSDTFRLAEALEAGAIPICDDWPGWRDKPVKGLWEMLFPGGTPFPIVENWNQLPRVMADILNNYESKAAECRYFWSEYKRKYYSWLGEDLRALGAM